jgi:hypothetical protein
VIERLAGDLPEVAAALGQHAPSQTKARSTEPREVVSAAPENAPAAPDNFEMVAPATGPDSSSGLNLKTAKQPVERSRSGTEDVAGATSPQVDEPEPPLYEGSESKALRARLVQCTDALDRDDPRREFIHWASYELQATLNNIVGFDSLLLDPSFGPLTESQRRYGNYILSSAWRLHDSICHVLIRLATASSRQLTPTTKAVVLKLTDKLIKLEFESKKDVDYDTSALTEQVDGGTETPSTVHVSQPLDIQNDDQIVDALKKRGIPPDLCRQVAAALTVAARPRPKWDDRAKYGDLAHLNAPRFLKAVYPDLLDADGNLTNEDAVRLNDPTLVKMVQGYIYKRQQRSLGLGDAKGLLFTNREGIGRPKKPRSKNRKRALQVNSIK